MVIQRVTISSHSLSPYITLSLSALVSSQANKITGTKNHKKLEIDFIPETNSGVDYTTRNGSYSRGGTTTTSTSLTLGAPGTYEMKFTITYSFYVSCYKNINTA